MNIPVFFLLHLYVLLLPLFQTDADGHQGDASLVPAPQMVAAAAKNKSPRLHLTS